MSLKTRKTLTVVFGLLLVLTMAVTMMGCDRTQRVVVTGEKGDNGSDGKSAYDLAVEQGFTGDLTQWLTSLIGPAGVSGSDGAAGKSILDLYKEISGNENKTINDLLADLKGDKGDDGATGQQGIAGQSCTVTKTGAIATIACGSGNTVQIKDGTNGTDGVSPTVTVTTASTASCSQGGVVINGVTSCFNGTSTAVVTGSIQTVKLCSTGVEYGLLLGNKLFAVYHRELSTGKSDTYLAFLDNGNYVTTDGLNCQFNVTYGTTSVNIGGANYNYSTSASGSSAMLLFDSVISRQNGMNDNASVTVRFRNVSAFSLTKFKVIVATSGSSYIRDGSSLAGPYGNVIKINSTTVEALITTSGGIPPNGTVDITILMDDLTGSYNLNFTTEVL